MEVVTILGLQIPTSTIETILFGVEVYIVGVIGFAIGYTVALTQSYTSKGVDDDL